MNPSIPVSASQSHSRPTTPHVALPTDLPDDTIVKTLTTYGAFHMDQVHYKVDARCGLESVLTITTTTRSSSPTWMARCSSTTPDPHPE
jgi:hypothetical protein